MKKITLATLVLLLFFSGVCFSQQTYWRFDGTEKSVRTKPKRKTVPNEYRVLTLDLNALKSQLAQTVVRNSNGILTKPVMVDFPMEDGTTEAFIMEKTYTLAPALEALYPDITSYFGVSQKNPLNKIYVSMSQLGLAGLVTGEKTIYIDTYDFLKNDGRYIVYDRAKCTRAENDGFECHAEVDMVDIESLPPSMQFRNSTDGIFRTFDLAVACTSEYTNYYGNTVVDALAAINTTITRVNSVYKRDFAVVFQVVASNNRLVYRNNVNIDATPDPDPYDNYDGSQMLGINTSNITGLIGASAYDVGHVFSTGGGGIASTAPCNATSKGSGVTGIVTPQFDPFDIDYVCHEIGHQFGASHTQNNNCQRAAAAAMEPGSGSTIMGYAGICAPNVQNNSDAYFHAYSIQQITGGMTGYTCDTETTINNAEPTISTVTAYTIPRSTPFVLTATASDANGDTITYCWEQMNNGTTAGEVMPPAPTNTTRPAFRSLTPTTDPSRTFPNLNAIINNVTPTWEVLPSVARTMNFRVTARDNNSLGGQTNQANTTLTVSGTAGPFAVTAPNTNETWYVGETKTVTWSVNSTNTLSANVNIRLSTDGGLTYPITLASGVTNNGSANVTVPNNIGTNNRVRIDAASNIFFDISNTNFTIKANTFELTTAQNTVSVCSPTSATYSFTYTPAPTFSATTTFTATGLPSGATASFTPTTRNTAGSVSLIVGNLAGITPGTYNFNVVGTSGSNVVTLPMVLRIFNSTIGDVTLTSPINGAPNQQTSCLLTWNAIATASSYTVQISTDPTFTTITETATVTATSYQTTLLAAGTLNYWRVRPNNPCVNGNFSPTFAFQIASDICKAYDQEYFEFNDSVWETNSTNAVSARVDVADNIVISEVSFYMRATHAALNDIKMQFSGPTGIFAEIYNRDCTGANFDVTWDDDGTVLTCGNVTPATNAGLEGIQQPSQPLSKFDGTSSLGTWVLLATDRGANTSGGTFNEFRVDICGKLQIVNNITVTNSGVRAPLGLTTTIPQSKLSSSQPGATASDLVYVLTDLPDNGTLKKNNVNLTLGQTFTQADINGGLLTYTHGGANSNPDSFTVVVRGTNLALSEAKTTDITICSFATNPTQTNVTCFGASTGVATVSPSGGTAPYTYLWSTGATTASISGLAAGNYSVTITDATGCTMPQSFTITQPAAALTVNVAGQTNVNCFGNATGAASVNVTGGIMNYTYDWTPGTPTGDGTASVTGLTAGTWTCTVTDANGCTASRVFTITQPAAALTVNVAGQTNVNCFGNATGAASVNVTGGIMNYTYDWTPGTPTGDGTASVTGLTAGTWTCTVTDANGCSASRVFTITQPAAALTVNVAGQTNVNCFGNATGAASVSVAGGTTNYTYDWTPGTPTGDGTASVTGLTAGTWTCTVTDANGCSASRVFTITQPAAALTVNVAGQTNVNCFGNATGAASVSVSGGTTNYTYDWTPGTPTGDGTASVTGLTAGTWTCTVTDANGCSASRVFTISQPGAALTVNSAGQTNVNCFGNATGAASVSVSGGTTGYSYNWTPGNPTGDGTASVTGLTAGTWTCTVTDANGCTASRVFTISQPGAALTVNSAGQTNVNCFGNATGAASVSVSGGTTNYTYDWTPGTPAGDGTASVTGLTAGTWTCTVTDANGCTASRVFTISQPGAALTVNSAGQTNVNCFGNATGAASVSVSGGTTNYTYDWTPGTPTGDGTASVTGLTAGTWTCTVTDANGCSASRVFTISQPGAALTVNSAGQTNVNCFGNATGAASVSVAGGTTNYTYDWTPGNPTGDGTASVTGLTAGTWTCTVTDANGCTASRVFTITQPGAALTVNSAGQTNVNCFGNATGAASVSVSGGTTNYTYDWTPGTPTGDGTASVTGLTAGTWTCTVTDANGCSASRVFTITQPAAALTVNVAGQTNVNCFGNATGAASVSVSGGTTNYTYDWTPGTPTGDGTASVTGLTAGTWTCTVTDANGCTASRVFTITQPGAALTVNSAGQTNVNCFGNATGAASVSVSGGTTGYSYNWTPGNPTGDGTASVTGLTAGTWTCTVTDANGCSASRVFTITQPAAALTVNVAGQTNVNCFGNATGAASVSVSGGTTNYTYDWTPGTPTGDGTASVTGLTAGTWTCTVTDANGCSASRVFTITQPGTALSATISSTSISCFGETNGSATVVPSGGAGGYQYSWSPSGGTAATASGLAAGTYICTITDANGCVVTKTAEITAPASTTYTSSGWSNGYPTAGMKAIISSNYTASSDLTACILEVTDSAIVTVNSGLDFNIAKQVIVAPTAQLIFQNNSNLLQSSVYTTNTNSGKIEVRRNAQMWRQDYVYWGSPVTQQKLRSFSPETLENRFYVLDEPTNSFKGVFTAAPGGLGQAPNTYEFVPAKGYMVRAPNTFPNPGTLPQVPTFTGVFTGLPNNGNVSIGVTKSAANLGYNLLGNPYPSTVDAYQFLAQNPGTLYFWTHYTQNSASNNYASFTTLGGSAAYPGGVVPNGFIQVGQGFLYQNANGITTANFTNSMRAGNNDNQFFRTSNGVHRLWLNLAYEGQGQSQMLLGYTDVTTYGVDPGYDGLLIDNGNSIATLIEDVPYVIQARPTFEETDQVPMHIKATAAGNYSISIADMDGLFLGDQPVYIKDNLTGVIHDIKLTPYAFTTEAGTFDTRFEIVYQNTALGIDQPSTEAPAVTIYENEDVLTVSAGSALISKVTIFDIRGRQLYQKMPVEASVVSLADFTAEQQVLLMQVVTDKGLVTKKFIH